MRCNIFTLSLFIATSSITMAHAQLSYNPWTEPNDAETISKYYQKLEKMQNDSIEYYEPEATTEIDKTAAYLEVPPPPSDSDEDSGLLNKVSNLFQSKKEPVLIPNTEENRQALNEIQNDESQSNSSDSLLDSSNEMLNAIGFDKVKNSIKRKIPRLNAKNMIRKFEKASGVNFKSLARKMKR